MTFDTARDLAKLDSCIGLSPLDLFWVILAYGKFWGSGQVGARPLDRN